MARAVEGKVGKPSVLKRRLEVSVVKVVVVYGITDSVGKDEAAVMPTRGGKVPFVLTGIWGASISSSRFFESDPRKAGPGTKMVLGSHARLLTGTISYKRHTNG